MTHGKYYVTGGTAARDHAYISCHNGDTDNGAWDALLLSGPIDAPDTLPAGACTRETHQNAHGDAIPSALYSFR